MCLVMLVVAQSTVMESNGHDYTISIKQYTYNKLNVVIHRQISIHGNILDPSCIIVCSSITLLNK